MKTKYKKSGVFDKEYFAKPRIVFDEAFEAQVASGKPHGWLQTYVAKLRAGQYAGYVEFALRHKYALAYGLVGSLILGVIGGFICVAFGWFVDSALQKRFVFNQKRSGQNKQYNKHKHAFLVKEYSLLVEAIWGGLAIFLLVYTSLIAVFSEIPAANTFLISWYKIMESLTHKIAWLIPGIDKYAAYFNDVGYYSITARVTHVMAISWFLILLPLPLFINYCIYLVRKFNVWSYNIEQHNVSFLRQIYGLIGSFILFCIFFDAFFLGEKWEFVLESPFFAGLAPLVCLPMLMAACLWLGTIIKINR